MVKGAHAFLLGMEPKIANDCAVKEQKTRAPIQLKLVTMPSHLGDLSEMPARERAELVEQDGRRRIMEEMLIAESGALRSFFWVAGICTGGFSAAVCSGFLLETVYSSSYANSMVLIVPLRILNLVGVGAGIVALYPSFWFGIRWIRAMRRRRRYLSTGRLMQKR